MPEDKDQQQIKDPATTSGWGRDEQGRDKQDFSDIANPEQLKPEFRQGRQEPKKRDPE